MIEARYRERGARAVLLAAQSEAAREPLEFAALLSNAQGALAAAMERLAFSGRLADDADKLAPLHEPLLRVVAERGPAELAMAGERRAEDDPSTARTRLRVYWSGEGGDYLSRALMQPYAELLRARNLAPDRIHHRGHCPFCGSKPWISARKAASDGDGGFRWLGCALCGLEWSFNRICCPSCFEEDPHRLPVFQSDAHPLVRIEACETCRRYVKSIDLTQDARQIPPIDDLVSLSMDLWALEEGYSRIEMGIGGI